MPACCSRCAFADIPLVVAAGKLCAVCGKLLHSICAIGPLCDFPLQFFELMRNTTSTHVPLHPDGYVCPDCFDLHGSVAVPSETVHPFSDQVGLDFGTVPQPMSDNPVARAHPKQTRVKRKPERFIDSSDSSSESTTPTKLDTPMRQIYDATLPLLASPETPLATSVFLADGESIKRKRLVPVPAITAGSEYKLQPITVTVMKDSALAAENAIHAVFDDPDTTMNFTTCGVHATVIWFNNASHFHLFRSQGKKARIKMTGNLQHDFNCYRDHCLSTALAPALMDAMLRKWENDCTASRIGVVPNFRALVGIVPHLYRIRRPWPGSGSYHHRHLIGCRFYFKAVATMIFVTTVSLLGAPVNGRRNG
jgi:hypothetical protein